MAKKQCSPVFKFRASQNAHERLEKKNWSLFKKTGKEYYQQRSLYHGHVAILQKRKGKILSSDERKRAFNEIISDFY